MRTALAIGLVLLLVSETAFACVDVLFVLDPSSELKKMASEFVKALAIAESEMEEKQTSVVRSVMNNNINVGEKTNMRIVADRKGEVAGWKFPSTRSRPRSTKVANELAKRNGLRTSVAVRRHGGRYVFMMAKTSADLIATLDTVDGDYERYLSMVTSELMRRQSERPLVILLFSEAAVNATMSAKWKDLSHSRKIHVFRVGTAKPTNELSNEGESFEDIIACSALSKETADVRRQQANLEQHTTTTLRPRIIPFSKTTRPPTTTRPVTVPGPKVRPVYRRKDNEAELEKVATRDVHAAPPPLAQTFSVSSDPPSVTTQNTADVTKRTADREQPNSTTTARPRIIPPVTVPSPKFRAVYRRKDKENEVEKVATHDALPTPQPLVHASLAPSQPPATTRASVRGEAHRPPIHTAVSTSFIEIHTPFTPPPHTPGPVLNQRATTPRTHAQPAVATSRPVRVTTTTAVDRTPPGCIADVTFLMDFSDGTGDKSKEYLDIAAAAVGRLPISEHAVRVSLIRFSGPGRTETLFHFDKHVNKDDLIEELFRMEPTGGTTRTGEALQYAIREFGNRKHGARKNARKFIVLFTDGYAQDDPATAADAARGEGITVVAVAVKDRFKPNELELVEITRNREMILISPNGQQLREKILGNQCPL